jgi:hypothetical protein
MSTRWVARWLIAAVMSAMILALGSAPAAARTCPSPGTSLAGAANMANPNALPHMQQAMDLHTNSHGDAGMFRAVVVNTAC